MLRHGRSKQSGRRRETHLDDLLLRELALLGELAELAHVRDEQLGDMLARERVAVLRLERIPERGDDVRLGLLLLLLLLRLRLWCSLLLHVRGRLLGLLGLLLLDLLLDLLRLWNGSLRLYGLEHLLGLLWNLRLRRWNTRHDGQDVERFPL